MKTSSTTEGTLGTFGGVFTPSILTILGIILFLRLGFVVGQAGLLLTLAVICLANLISILTSISLAAIATNLRVKGGGYYYIISRTLGLEFGGALGIVLFLAQSISISIGFYCIGFGEALSVILPPNLWTSPQLLALYALLPIFLLAWLGADWATKFQYLVMACLALALGSFFLGGSLKWEISMAVTNWTAPASGLGFWAVFAVFFPAVTGFTQGVNMSGDLKDPGRSLPVGTFAAVGLLPFAQGVGPMNNPRRGVMLSAGIAVGIIGMGKLNAIAPLVSMFFLLSYGLLNYATLFLPFVTGTDSSFSRSPGKRTPQTLETADSGLFR